MRKILFIGFMLISALKTIAQPEKADSLKNALNVPGTSIEDKLDIYKKLSGIYFNVDLNQALIYAKEGLQIARKEKKDKTTLATFNRIVGVINNYQSSFDTARIHLDEALNIALEINDKTLVKKIYSDIGNSYLIEEKLEQAVEYYMKGLSTDNESDELAAIILINIGNIYRTLKNQEQAESFHLRALEMGKELNLENIKMGAYQGLGLIYADKEETEKAISYMREALTISRKLGNKTYEISCLVSLSARYSATEEYEKALIHCKEALRLAEELGSPRDIQNTYNVLASIYMDMKLYKECEAAALKSWAMDSVTLESAAGTALSLSVAYIHLEEKDKATYFVRKFAEINSKQSGKSLHDSLADMEVKYETEKKEIMIASLQNEKQLYFWLGISGVLFAVALATLLLQKIKSNKREKQLIATRSVLDGEMGERARLARDLHDRLSGSLAAVKIGMNDHKESLRTISDKLDSCIDEVRRVAHNLMPVSLRHGLKTALEDFAEQFPNVHFHFFGKENHIDERTAYIMYCSASELVNNSLKHSGAEYINIQLIQNEKYVSLTVQDNGCGYNDKTMTKGCGIRNIYDRIMSCGGKIDILTSPGKGTETTIELTIHSV